jgi:hypothetical protein
MKKAALTFGLFSLVMVATSFATPQKNDIYAQISSVDSDGGNQQGKNGKKLDIYNESNNLNSFENQFNSDASASQVTKSRIKLD